MKKALRNKSKYTGFKRLLYSAKYSIDGLMYAYKNEKSLILHGIVSLIAIVIGIIVKLNRYEWCIIVIVLGIILAFELVNTALEACVDMVTTKYNELAKIAKDCGSAASFVTSCIGGIISLYIYIPKLIYLFIK